MPELKGEIIFAFTHDEGGYHVYYDEVLASGPGYNRVAGAIYKLMQEYPELIDQVLQMSIKASEELSQPFNDILNERPSEN